MSRTRGLCEMCGTERPTLATVVDHIKPLALGGSDEDTNTRNLCDAHHLEVTAEQFGHSEPIKGKGVGRDGRPTSPEHPWHRRPA